MKSLHALGARLLLSGLLALGCAAAQAWNDHGHMVVAALAYQKLAPQTRHRAARLVRLNPRYAAWTEGIPEKQKDEVAFIRAATWPDEIKNDDTYSDDRDSSAEASRNIGYEDRLRHRYWHFENLTFSPDGTPTVPPARPNVRTQIAEFRRVLASPEASPQLKSYDLCWLLHLVGDAHNPLHATSRFTRETPAGDQGGHLVQVRSGSFTTDLHAYWDNIPGKSRRLEAVKDAAARLEPADPGRAAIAEEASWIEESFSLAKSEVYVYPIGAGSGPYQVDARYRANARSVVARRLAQAGARLANLLEGALR